MMRYLFLIVICHISLLAQATMTFSQERIDQKNYWIVSGQIDLPERNLVNMTMYLDHYLVPKSDKMLYVRQGRFTYKLPIKKRPLSGNYEIKLIYKKNNKRRSQMQNQYIGDPQDEVNKRKEYNLFFRNFIGEVTVLNDQSKKETNDFLEQPPIQRKADDINMWVSGLKNKLIGIQKNLDVYSTKRVLIPYSYNSIKKARQILVYMESLLYSDQQKVMLHFKMSKSSNHILSDVKTKSYENSLQQLILQIKKREQFAEYLDQKSVRSDLMWINTLYSRYSNAYTKSQTKLRKNLWEAQRQDFSAQMKNFAKRLEDYEQARFMQENKKVLHNLREIYQLLIEADIVYTIDLYQKANIALSSEMASTKSVAQIQNAIKDVFYKVFQQIENLTSEEQKQKFKLVESMEETLKKISSMQNELQKKYMSFIQDTQQDKLDNRQVSKWQKRWKKKMLTLHVDLQKILVLQRTYKLRGIPVSWNFFVKYFTTIEYHYKKVLQLQQNQNTMISINKNHAQIQKMINKIRIAIAKEK